MDQKDITVGLCTYNRAEMLSQTLKSLDFQETGGHFSFDILVIDDGSTDHTEETVRSFSRGSNVSTRYLRNDQQGVGAARSKVVRESTSPWIAFIDDDEQAETCWLKKLYEVVSPTGPFIVGGANHLLLPEEILFRLSAVCRMLLGEGIYPFTQPGRLTGGTSPGSGNVLVARQVFQAVGLFDNEASAGEDSDLWNRAQKAGYAMWHSPEAVIFHAVPPERLTDSYFRWNSLRWGNNFAGRDWKLSGPEITLLKGIARIGKIGIIIMPGVGVSWLRGDKKTLLDRKCALWRSVGYLRRCLSMAVPDLFPQARFFQFLDFRKERDIVHR